jgi:preprotein translocase subunit SecE
MTDKIKLIVTALIVVIGIGAFYYFGDQPGYVLAGILLATLAAAIAMFYQTAAGKQTWEFVKGARQEMRKVVWPHQRETIQVTAIVFVMAVVVAIFLWVVDWSLSKILVFTRG